MSDYAAFKKEICQGWNTWDTRSIASHVLLPEGFAIQLGLREYRSGKCLKTPLIGRLGQDEETVKPGMHAYGGGYTDLQIDWEDQRVRIQSATVEDELVLLVTPLQKQLKATGLIVEASMLWNRPGQLSRETDHLLAQLASRQVRVYSSQPHVDESWSEATGPYLFLELHEAICLSTGKPRSLEEVSRLIDAAAERQQATYSGYGEEAESYRAIQSCLAWDTIYEPSKDRLISPVSRIWSCRSGGYCLFCWDNYFAAYMASLGSREVAYANAIEMTGEATPDGFVPNSANGVFNSLDRSQPPVGSAMVREIYRRHREPWLLEQLFAGLLRWNRWWPEARDTEGYLCWGSNAFEPRVGNDWESNGVHDRFGAALESGLDNSPMYDDVPFDKERNQLAFADAGLMGLYVWDCENLADIAEVLQRSEADELRERAAKYRQSLRTLWDEEAGIFCNRRLDTGAFCHRYSPTNFYPLLADAATPEQATRMVQEHLLNPASFWGEWVLPSIARNDPAYSDQHYWRGRIWAPMNFLVYLGLRRYPLAEACAALSERSQALLLKEWLEKGHVHENYCADTGAGLGRDPASSDAFYHWGGLLGMIALIEKGHVPGPEQAL